MLPAQLQAAVQRLAEGSARRGLAARAADISARYRERKPSAASVGSAEDVLAYALTRLPATYAAVAVALARLAARLPDFAPRTLLDLGCGPGTAAWAALSAYPGIEQATLVDTSPHFLAAARALAADHPALAEAAYVTGTLSAPPPGSFDLVVVSYALTELPDPAAVIDRIWSSCAGVLLIVEPGTPRDHERLMRVREKLVALGGNIAAPCPHHEPCPLTPPDWCHFSVRLSRTRDHMRIKGGTLGYEDEKYSYLAVARQNFAPARQPSVVLATPFHAKFEVRLKLCTPSGDLVHARVAKRDPGYRAAKKLNWGDDLGD